MNDKISIAMAVYNGEKFIEQQLDSILNQTRRPNEIIICDDSPDNKTFNAIENIIARFPGIIKYFKNDSQLGVSKNFEKAISMTSGDIILLADQDDVWHPGKVEKLCSLLTSSPDYGGAFCNSELVAENLNPLGVTHFDLRGFNGHPKTDIEMLEFFLCRVPAAGHNMAFKSEFKELILPFPELDECHDTWIGLVIAATKKWAFINDTLTKFRQHTDNVSQAGRSSQLKAALDSIKNNVSTWTVALYDELIRRLAGKAKPGILELLKDRREHSATRAKMNCNIFKRLPLVLREIKNKRYFRYGRGWKNAIQDIFLRGL
jgi:glycosyltransferase involved in cell wall biosynthesis